MLTSARAFKRFTLATFFIAGYALFSGAIAQQAYKCGNAYSETPCAGGKAIDARDKRTDEQKAQADKTTGDTEKVVKKLAAERKTQERDERAQVGRDKAAQKAEADKKKVHRTPLAPHAGKKLKPEKPAKPAKPEKPAKPAKPAKTAKNPA